MPRRFELIDHEDNFADSVTVWELWAKHFREARNRVRSIRDKHGLRVADAEHERIMNEFEPEGAWDDMFMQAYWRHPEQADAIDEARHSFYDIFRPLYNKADERKLMLKELKMMRQELREIYDFLIENIRETDGHVEITGEPERLDAEHMLRPYEEILMDSDQAKSTAEEIKLLVDEIKALGRRYQAPIE